MAWGEQKSCHQSGWQIWFVSLSLDFYAHKAILHIKNDTILWLLYTTNKCMIASGLTVIFASRVLFLFFFFFPYMFCIAKQLVVGRLHLLAISTTLVVGKGIKKKRKKKELLNTPSHSLEEYNITLSTICSSTRVDYNATST